MSSPPPSSRREEQTQNEHYLERFFSSLLSAERTPRPVGRHAREVERRSRCRLLAREDPALTFRRNAMKGQKSAARPGQKMLIIKQSSAIFARSNYSLQLFQNDTTPVKERNRRGTQREEDRRRPCYAASPAPHPALLVTYTMSCIACSRRNFIIRHHHPQTSCERRA